MQYRYSLMLAVLALSLLPSQAHASYAYSTTFSSSNPSPFGGSSAVTLDGTGAPALAGSVRLVLARVSLATTQSPARTDQGSVPFSINVNITDPSGSANIGTLVVTGTLRFSQSDTSGEASTLCCVTVTPAITINGSIYTISPTSLSYVPPVVNSTAAGDIEAKLDVTVQCAAPLQITCPADITLPNDLGQPSAVVALTPPAVSDHCPGITVTGTRDDGQPLTVPFPLGATRITWTAVDTAGHTASCSQLVTVTASRIGGVVFPDSSGRRQADPGVPPLRGITVALRDVATTSLLATTTTGSRGEFSFSVLRPGSYEVALELAVDQVVTAALAGPSGRARAVGDHLQVTLMPGDSAAGLAFLLRTLAGPMISGHVWSGSRSGCQPTATDQPVPDLLLRLLDTTGHELIRTFTLADGRYFLALPPAGPGYLIVPALPALPLPGAGAQVAGSSALLIPSLAANQNYPDNNFLAARSVSPAGPATLEGYTISASSGPRQTALLAGVIVQLRGAAGQLLTRTSSGAEGQFFFPNLPVASYSLEALPLPGYTTAAAVPGQNGSPGSGESLQVMMVPGLNEYPGYVFAQTPGLVPTAANSISGTVTGPAGTGNLPRPGTLVILEQFLPGLPSDPCRPAGEGVLSEVVGTDAAGHYQFANVAPGTYRVAVLGPQESGEASAGPNAMKIDSHTLQVNTVAGVTQYPSNDFTLSP